MKNQKIIFALLLSLILVATASLIWIQFGGNEYMPAPVANFTGTPTSGNNPLTVTFTDSSTNTPTGWAWFFGDEIGSGSWTLQTNNPGWKMDSALAGKKNMACVALSNNDILYTGGVHTNVFNEVWRSSNLGASWTQLSAPAWPARWFHTACRMSDGSVLLMGGTSSGGPQLNDVWRSTNNGDSWTQMKANDNNYWSKRYGLFALPLSDGSVVMCGGASQNDVWRSTDNGATWVQQTANWNIGTRYGEGACVLPDDTLVVVGGTKSGINANDVWTSNDQGATWTRQTAAAGWPTSYMPMVVALPDGSILEFGGYTYTDPSGERNQIWRSVDKGANWTRVNTGAEWGGRTDAGYVVTPSGHVVIIAGSVVGSLYYDVWSMQAAGAITQNPSHQYTERGVYDVILTARNSSGFNIKTRLDYISDSPPTAPNANFSGAPTSGNAPLTVTFTDSTTGDGPFTYNWTFGDGNSSTLQNPTHTYYIAGTYTVRLVATNSGGLGSKTSTGYIVVKPTIGIQNGTFETGDLTSWTTDVVSNSTQYTIKNLSATQMQDNVSGNWTAGELIGKYIHVVTGTNSGKYYEIFNNGTNWIEIQNNPNKINEAINFTGVIDEGTGTAFWYTQGVPDTNAMKNVVQASHSPGPPGSENPTTATIWWGISPNGVTNGTSITCYVKYKNYIDASSKHLNVHFGGPGNDNASSVYIDLLADDAWHQYTFTCEGGPGIGFQLYYPNGTTAWDAITIRGFTVSTYSTLAQMGFATNDQFQVVTSYLPNPAGNTIAVNSTETPHSGQYSCSMNIPTPGGYYTNFWYSQIKQDVDFTYATKLRFWLKGNATYNTSSYVFRVRVGNSILLSENNINNTTFTERIIDVTGISGVNTVLFEWEWGL